jgi:predicted anti-sigma-YlaC factor YlaD
MSCLRPEEIYARLDGGLDPAEASRIERHLAECPACRIALDERRLIQQAAESLPSIAVPADFAAGITARLEPAEDAALPRLSLRGWLAATFAGAGTFGLALTLLALLSGHNLGTYFLHLSQALIGYLQDATATAIKLAKYLLLFLKIAREFAGAALDVLKRATAFIGPEVQAACLLAALAFLAAGAFLWKRRQLTLENRHDQ